MPEIPEFVNECDVITIFPMGAECVVSHPSTVNASNGSSSLNITGGTPPYNVTWENGSKGLTINNLSVGEYNAVIQDYYGDITIETTCVLTGETDCSFNISVTNFSPTPTPTPTPTLTPTPTPTPTLTPTSVVTSTPTPTPTVTPPSSFSFSVTGGAFNVSGACLLASQGVFGTTVWSTVNTITTGIYLYSTQSGAETENPSDYLMNGFYGIIISGQDASIQINGGEIVDIEFCPVI